MINKIKQCETPCLCDTCLSARDKELNRVRGKVKEEVKKKFMFISHAEFCKKNGEQYKKCCKCILEEL